MEGLKREHLENGKIYWCRLSERPVLVIITEVEVEDSDPFPDKDTPKKKVRVIRSVCFNHRQGILQEQEVYDYQLTEISDKDFYNYKTSDVV